MADNIIKVNVTANKTQRVTVSSANVGTEITASSDTGKFWAQNAKNWAVSENIVDGEDYSSKYYANKSKGYAQNAESFEAATRETYNSFVSDANDYRSELTELKDVGVEEINKAVASGKDEINSTKTTILNDIEFVADGEKKEIEDLIDSGKEELKESIGDVKVLTTLEIGDIGIAPLGIDETKGKRRYLNGQIIIQEQYVQFTNKVKSAVALYPSLACTESEWQTTATMTVGGQVGKFVVDDEGGTIRLPKIIMPIQGLTDLSKLGEIVEAGLPNITGEHNISGSRGILASSTAISGCFIHGRSSGKGSYGNGGDSPAMNKIGFDASKSNPTYGNSNTVQQEQIQYPYFIQVATGAETEDNIINEIELNNPFSLLDYKYSEYELNNLSWLRSNGQYNSKAVYPAVYDLLLKIYNGTETKAGVSVKSTDVMKAFKETGSTGYYWLISTETPRIGQSVYTTDGRNVGYITSITSTNGFTFLDISGTYFTAERNTGLDTTIPYTDYDFVLNTAEETFRLPVKVKLASGKAVVGNGKALGLDAGINQGFVYSQFTGNLHRIGAGIYTKVPPAIGSVATDYITGDFPGNYATGVTTDPTKSGIETSDSGLYLYFYVGETVQNANLINAGRIEETLATKTDKVQASQASMPSSKYIDLTLGANNTHYTAPANGWVLFDKVCNGSNQFIQLVNKGPSQNDVIAMSTIFGNNGSETTCYIPVKKGDIFKIGYNAGGALGYLRFIYAEGEV